jgi:predicted MFS family arabinose efflux permease
MNRKERMILIILGCLNFTHILDFMIMMPLDNYLVPYFKISPQQFAILVGSYTISAGISSLIGVFFVDRFDRKNVLMFGYIGFLLGTIACGLADSYVLLLSARIFAGVFGGLIGAQVLSIVSDGFGYERRGQAMGAIMASFAAASIVGVPLSLYLCSIFSWHAPFLLVGGLGILVIPLVQQHIPSITTHIKNDHGLRARVETFTAILKDGRQRQALLFTCMMMIGHFMIIPFINPFMEFNNGYSKDVQTPLIYLVGGLASLAASNVLGKMADRYGKMPVLAVSVILSVVTVAGITNLPPINFIIVLAIFAFWFILSTGRMITANAMVTNVVRAEHRGSFMSFNNSVQQFGISIAALIAGLIITEEPDHKINHYSWLGYLSGAVLLIALFLAQRLFSGMDKKPVIKDTGEQ